MRCLLDKVIARYTVQGLIKLDRGQILTVEEVFSLDLLQQSHQTNTHLYLSPPSANVLQKLAKAPNYSSVINFFLEQVQVLEPTLYFRRWSRRLREYSFTREDAAILGLATFGTDQSGEILGVNYVATFDQPMINNWNVNVGTIRMRLFQMQQSILPPYRYALFPNVMRPDQIAALTVASD